MTVTQGSHKALYKDNLCIESAKQGSTSAKQAFFGELRQRMDNLPSDSPERKYKYF